MGKIKKVKPRKEGEDYARVWRVVEGAVRDCFNSHPEYLTRHGKKRAVESLAKRLTGSVRAALMEPTVPAEGKAVDDGS